VAEISADEPGIMIIFLDQVSNLDALNYDSPVLFLYADDNLFREFEDGGTDSVENVIGDLLLIEL
jgi:hypothetical protein